VRDSRAPVESIMASAGGNSAGTRTSTLWISKPVSHLSRNRCPADQSLSGSLASPSTGEPGERSRDPSASPVGQDGVHVMGLGSTQPPHRPRPASPATGTGRIPCPHSPTVSPRRQLAAMACWSTVVERLPVGPWLGGAARQLPCALACAMSSRSATRALRVGRERSRPSVAAAALPPSPEGCPSKDMVRAVPPPAGAMRNSLR